MKRTLLPLLLATLLLAGAGCSARPSVQPTVPSTPTTSQADAVVPATTDVAPSTDWIGFHSDALKFSVSYAPSLAPDTTDEHSVAFSEVESGYGTYGVTASATTAKDTAAWVAEQSPKLTPFFLIKNGEQTMEVVERTDAVVDEDHGRPIHDIELEAVEVSNGMAYTLTWRNSTPIGTLPTLPTLMNADTLKFLQSFSVDVPPLSPEDQAWHEANTALAQFLGLLHERTYAAAGGRYGGDMTALYGWNPMVDQSDVATLWKNGCELNGLLCMQVASITPVSNDANRVLTFNVEFRKDDGLLYDKNGQRDFPFVVRAGSDGLYYVETMPLYQQ